MGGLLAGLDAFLVAVAFAAALLVTASILRPLLVSVLGQAPLVGGWLAGNVDAGLARFQASLQAPADAAIGVLADVLDWLGIQGRRWAATAISLAEASWAGSWRLATVTLPHALELERNFAGGLFSQALGEIQSTAQKLQAQLASSEASILATVNQLIGIEASRAREELLGVERVALDEVRKVELTTGQLFLQAVQEARAGVAHAEGVAAQLTAAERKFAEDAISIVVRDLEAGLRAQGRFAEDAIAAIARDLEAGLRVQGEGVSALEGKLEKQLDQLLDSPAWRLLKSLEAAGEGILATGTSELAATVMKKMREQLMNLPTVGQLQRSNIEAILSTLEKDLAK